MAGAKESGRGVILLTPNPKRRDMGAKYNPREGIVDQKKLIVKSEE